LRLLPLRLLPPLLMRSALACYPGGNGGHKLRLLPLRCLLPLLAFCLCLPFAFACLLPLRCEVKSKGKPKAKGSHKQREAKSKGKPQEKQREVTSKGASHKQRCYSPQAKEGISCVAFCLLRLLPLLSFALLAVACMPLPC
jgi:hypothetical protein